jgi:putative membrane protein
MKRILRHFIIDTFCLWVVSKTATGMVFEHETATLIVAGIGLTIASLIAKPIINILLLPLNLLTFGIFRWVASSVVLYIVTLIVKDFKIVGFNFLGLSSKWLDIPQIHFEGILAFIAFSFLLSIITSFIYWLVK